VGKHPFEQEGVVLAKAPGESLLELGSLPRSLPRASSAMASGSPPLDERPRHVASRCPMASEATEDSLMPASSRVLWMRFTSEVRSLVRALR